MFVESLTLADFRNYAAADISLRPGTTIFAGRNGQGKTNLAEAITYLATLGSHRVSQDAPLVRAEQKAAIVRARLAHGDRRVLLELQINRQGSNRARVGGTEVRTSELSRYAQVVLFAPEDLQIVRGDPSARRRFADQLLMQRRPRMAGVLADYDRVLRQRTALLKSAKARGIRGEALSTLDVWDDKLITLGSEVIRERQLLAAEMTQPLADAYTAIAGADHDPSLSWVLSAYGADPDDHLSAPESRTEELEAAFRSALLSQRSAEIDRGVTLVGPHRDDLLLTVRALPVKSYASHGESWSFALALRLASAQLLRQHPVAGDPILILDDVFAELDSDRRRRLAGLVAGFEQVIITAAVEDDMPEELRGRVIRVEAGTIRSDDDG